MGVFLNDWLPAAGGATLEVHPTTVRVTHTVNAVAFILMTGSGWGIYNSSPLFAFSFPRHLTLGGWLGGSLAWHFGVMWLLAGNLIWYVAYGLATGHLRRRLTPLRLNEIAASIRVAIQGRGTHTPGRYNAVQRLLYVLAICGLLAMFLSGLAIWKPIQLSLLCDLLGGYEAARRIHFVLMVALMLFVFIHVVQVIRHSSSVRPMIP